MPEYNTPQSLCGIYKDEQQFNKLKQEYLDHGYKFAKVDVGNADIT